MYQNVKDLYAILDRNHKVHSDLAQKHTGTSAQIRAEAYAQGLEFALGLLNVLLDEYDNGDQPTPAEIATSDLVDYKALMKCCRP